MYVKMHNVIYKLVTIFFSEFRPTLRRINYLSTSEELDQIEELIQKCFLKC